MFITWECHYTCVIDINIEIAQVYKIKLMRIPFLKGKFSSGIEVALASTLNHDFNWKELSEMILCIFSFDFFKVYLSNIDSETAEI